MVRFLLSFCFFLTISPIVSQVAAELKSIVTDRITRFPISYANVGFVDRGLGTVSDDTGYFELSFAENRINDDDLIQVTADGYYPLRVPFSVFKSAINKTKVLYLSPLTDTQEAIESQAQSNTWMTEDVGYTEQDDLVYAEWSETDQKGLEYATIINLPYDEVVLKNLKFKITEHNADKTKIRINVYDVENSPTKKIITSVYHTIRKKEGEEVVQLEKVCKPVSNKIAVGIEWLGSSGKEKRHFLKVAKAKDLGATFIKSTSHDNWQELPYHALGLSLEILGPSSLVTADKTKGKDHKINGVVTMSGKPVQGCEVRVKGELLYTQTREDGSFDISAAEDDVLEFRSLTTKPIDLAVKGQGNFRIILEPKYDQLEEVLLKGKKEEVKEEERMYMTAFGPKDPSKSGYRVIHKTREELNKTAINFSDLIAGKFPAPRGSSSIVLSNSRAIVVDGVVMDDRINPDDFLSPGMIASVTVIPSVGGNVMYGSAGRNGVIYVTTKSAEANWKFLKRKEKANNLFAKNNDYDNSAVSYREPVHGELYGFKTTETTSEAKVRYVGMLTTNMTNIDFYIKAFKYFLSKEEKYAYDILNTAREVAWNSPKALRSLSFMYEEQGKFEEAHMLYTRIGELEPLRSQTYVDLAQSHVSIGNYQKAFSLYKLMLDNKIPGVVFSDEVMEVVVTEVKHLVTQHKQHVDYRDLHPSFYSKALDLDGRIVIEWNDPQSEFEFQFVNPDNKFFKWSYVAASNYLDVLTSEKEGYQSKEFFVDNAETGKWLINMNTVRSDNKSGTVPRLVKCLMYENYGTPREIRTIKIIDLDQINKNTLIGAISMQ